MSSEAIDRISSLHDDIIHHILSFMHAKYAVQTSVLSRRWRHVWKSIPVINLWYAEIPTRRYDIGKYQMARFGFISNFLQKHRASNVEKIIFKFKLYLPCWALIKVVSFASCKNVKELYINGFDVEYKAHNCCPHLDCLKRVSPLCFSNLKTLIIDEESYHSLTAEGTSSFPNLENLILLCAFRQVFRIDIPTLERLEIEIARCGGYFYGGTINCPTIVLQTPKLTSVKIRGDGGIIPEFSLSERLSSVSEIEIIQETVAKRIYYRNAVLGYLDNLLDEVMPLENLSTLFGIIPNYADSLVVSDYFTSYS